MTAVMSGTRRGSALVATGTGFVVAGLLVAAVGVVIGLLPVHAPSSLGLPGATDCGTAFSPETVYGFNDPCQPRVHDRQVLTYVLIGAGGGVALLAGLGLLLPGLWVRTGDTSVTS